MIQSKTRERLVSLFTFKKNTKNMHKILRLASRNVETSDKFIHRLLLDGLLSPGENSSIYLNASASNFSNSVLRTLFVNVHQTELLKL